MVQPLQLPVLDDLDVDNRRVFVRVDFNVPLSNGVVSDATRIEAALPTLRELKKRGARLVLASHLGRPSGKGPKADPGLGLEPVAAKLAELTGWEVRLPDDVVGDAVSKLVTDTRADEVVLLENLRFHPGEKKNDPAFAQALAGLCDAYVNDAFGVSHRAHASVDALPKLVGPKAVGRLVERELAALSKLFDPEHPFVAIVGGAKVSDKIGVLKALIEERLTAGDALIIGGAMANTFMLIDGARLGASLLEADRVRDCRAVMAKASARDIRLLLPSDIRVGTDLDGPCTRTVTTSGGAQLEDEEFALDIGPDTQRRYARAIRGAKTVFWNGPMGVFENSAFAAGTLAVAKAVAACEGYCVVGGGDSVAAINQAGLADSLSHVSTGGGASLEFVEGRPLPGLHALLEEERKT